MNGHLEKNKLCKHCNNIKSIEEFYVHKNYRESICKACRSKRENNYRRSNLFRSNLKSKIKYYKNKLKDEFDVDFGQHNQLRKTDQQLQDFLEQLKNLLRYKRTMNVLYSEKEETML